MKHLPWDYGVKFHEEGDKIEVAFQPLPMADIMASVKVILDELQKVPSKEVSPEPHSTFGPCPTTQAADFDSQKEIEHLPFKLNMGDASLEIEHPAKFINLIYSNQDVFSSHDEDLGHCN